VVEYFFSAERGFAVAAHQGELTSPLALPVGSNDLIELLDTLDFELGVRERCRSLELLYDALFAPLERYLRGTSRLLIVPHGPLHRAPLHALRGPDGLYLAQRFTIQYAPSVGLAREVARRPWGGTFGSALLLAATQTPYCSLPALNFAAVEIDEAAKSLPGSIVLSGAEAVRRNLVRRQENVEILHCACHGEYDRDDPLLSRLFLADGPLYGYEIERFRFRPRIVVLSACESGIQKRMGGDETFGLIRALVSRGAETVVASLWKVADESTASMMGTFYHQLAKNPGDTAAALRYAQLDLLGAPQYAHPFYWAPYFATGAAPSEAQ
jgi:CHAT domain-containing protein